MDYAMYFVINKSLGMSTGKMLAQFGHAVTGLLLKNVKGSSGTSVLLENKKIRENWTGWITSGQTKVVLEANAEEFKELAKILEEQGVYHIIIVDEGRTEVPENSETVIGIFPATKEELAPYVGNLKLYKDEGQKAIVLLKELIAILKRPAVWSDDARIILTNYLNKTIKPKESYKYLLSLIGWV
jgi:peptidyl-tRNA hydrolase